MLNAAGAPSMDPRRRAGDGRTIRFPAHVGAQDREGDSPLMQPSRNWLGRGRTHGCPAPWRPSLLRIMAPTMWQAAPQVRCRRLIALALSRSVPARVLGAQAFRPRPGKGRQCRGYPRGRGACRPEKSAWQSRSSTISLMARSPLQAAARHAGDDALTAAEDEQQDHRHHHDGRRRPSAARTGCRWTS